MKLVMDERLKHRLVGLAVVISLGAIFVPAIMKQSNQRFDDKKVITIKLPPRPDIPKVLTQNEPAMFKRMTVAHVTLPEVKDAPKSTSKLAKAEPLSQMNDDLQTALADIPDAPIAIAEKKTPVVTSVPVKAIAAPAVVKKAAVVSAVVKQSPPKVVVAAKKGAASKQAYAVQLGTFSQQKNAVALVAKMKSKGYHSLMVQARGKHGTVYRVLVGQANQRQEAKLLQQKLARAEQVNGIIVTTNGLG